mmetsp:Transcript_168379/g.540967  ORF Transcript_168379/g.540967 Transcript_168379/m.540967 type:complete len:357 (+) Transcript_168379:115-1185(+)
MAASAPIPAVSWHLLRRLGPPLPPPLGDAALLVVCAPLSSPAIQEDDCTARGRRQVAIVMPCWVSRAPPPTRRSKRRTWRRPRHRTQMSAAATAARWRSSTCAMRRSLRSGRSTTPPRASAAPGPVHQPTRPAETRGGRARRIRPRTSLTSAGSSGMISSTAAPEVSSSARSHRSSGRRTSAPAAVPGSSRIGRSGRRLGAPSTTPLPSSASVRSAAAADAAVGMTTASRTRTTRTMSHGTPGGPSAAPGRAIGRTPSKTPTAERGTAAAAAPRAKGAGRGDEAASHGSKAPRRPPSSGSRCPPAAAGARLAARAGTGSRASTPCWRSTSTAVRPMRRLAIDHSSCSGARSLAIGS